MPKLNEGRTVQVEVNLAKRIEYERVRRGQSHEALAELMSKAGCSMAGSSVYRIERGKPPRRISVDELATLAKIWDLSIEDLLLPVELVEQKWASEVVEAFAGASDRLDAAYADVVRSALSLVEIAVTSADLDEFVTYQIQTALAGTTQWFAEFADLEGAEVSRLAELGGAFWDGVLKMVDRQIEKRSAE